MHVQHDERVAFAPPAVAIIDGPAPHVKDMPEGGGKGTCRETDGRFSLRLSAQAGGPEEGVQRGAEAGVLGFVNSESRKATVSAVSTRKLVAPPADSTKTGL